MEAWISKTALLWISIGSGVCILIGAIAFPWIIIHMREDAFSNTARPSWLDQKPVTVRVPLRVLKNLLGLVLILLGLAMLVLPGQGVLCIVLGIMLVDIPRKERLQHWILGKRKVMDSLNWLRQTFHRPPFEPPSA
jgi:Putative transmembrane protein (PGPGW)